MLSIIDRYVIARESNVVRVDFSRDPDPPAPSFPGANGLRRSEPERNGVDTPAVAIGGRRRYRASRFQSTTSALAQPGIIPLKT